jgi:hypothetical protein
MATTTPSPVKEAWRLETAFHRRAVQPFHFVYLSGSIGKPCKSLTLSNGAEGHFGGRAAGAALPDEKQAGVGVG